MPGAGSRELAAGPIDVQPLPPDVSAIITFHREGLLAHKSLLSLGRCRATALRSGITLEIIATLDRADPETERVVRAFHGTGQPDHLLPLDFGDLGLSRNAAIASARGRQILICDGDDYLSADFIVRCLETLTRAGDSAIVHPELVITFEGEHAMWWQTGSDAPGFDAACMLAINPWNSCCFAARDIFLQTPYAVARPGETGFGFEDWHWNCETLARGHSHLIATGATHYVRKKATGSLNIAHASQRALIPPTRLFGIRA
jgi:hypothetical protein